MKIYVGIDLGGTFIKGGIVDEKGHILCEDKVPTEVEKGVEQISQNIANLAKALLKRAGVEDSAVVGLGIGSPGMIDGKTGEVVFSANLGFEYYPLAERVGALTGFEVKLANDANVATLGEVKFGVAKDYRDVVMLTLGTGVGGGIVIDGKIIEGNQGAGAEVGHISIEMDGEPCSCGRKGCLEAYASATAIIRETKKAMTAHKDSKMWEIGGLDAVSGKTAFDYKDSDLYAKAVVDNYIRALASGITNFANIFRPQAVIIGGGVCAQGKSLTEPLQALVDKEIFAGSRGPQVPVLVAELGNAAGLLGAAALFME